MTTPVLIGPPMLSSSAAELLDRVATAPAAPVHAALGAPGGYGKTLLLQRLAEAYDRAGIPVVRRWRPDAGPIDPADPAGPALLIDDAHLLDPATLDGLGELADRPDARLVVAHRPWPRPPALARLLEALRRGGPPVTLAPMTEEQIAARLAVATAGPPTPALVGFVAAQTAGIPRYVARLADALAAVGGAPGTPVRVPPAALSPFAAEIDELAPDLRTLLLAVEAGAGLSFDLVAALLGPGAVVADLVDAGRASGLLASDGALVPLARQAIAALGAVSQRIEVRQRLAALQLARGGPVLPLVRPLLRVAGDATDAGLVPGTAGGGLVPGTAGGGLVPGTAGSGLGPVYEAAGEEALGDDPALAAELFAAAAGAGRTTLARRAFATALAGDLDLASRLADQVITAGPAEQRAEAAFVAATVLAHRGQTAQAAMLHEWASTATVAAAGFAAVALVGVGRPADAERLARPAGPAQPPTSLSAAATLMARGMTESVTGSPAAALSTMVQATTLIEPVGATMLLPDSPAAVAATLALHHAELDVAEAVLARAVRGGIGGALLTTRHRLLQGWVLLLRGRLADAERHLPAAGQIAPHGRDQLFATALRVGLSRRGSDLVGLRSAWPDACQALIGQPVDLFDLLPLGELTVAAARLGEQHRVAGHLADAERLLDDLGNPPLWSVPLCWSRLQAAIVADDRAAVDRHAAALDRVRESGPYTEVVATAAGIWQEVLADRAEPDAVVAAARRLSALGLTWDATRLVGQAAIRTADRKAMTLLLDTARAMQDRGADPVPAGAAARAKPAGQQLLSAREREVAALVLAGLTYKQIADRLYLSAKTVEHHIARIRQRLGCTDRQQLLTRLRDLIDEGESTR